MGKVIKHMLVDPITGLYSSSRVWYSLANIVASSTILYMSHLGTLSLDFFVAYLVVVGGHSAYSKFISFKYGNLPAPTENPIRVDDAKN